MYIVDVGAKLRNGFFFFAQTWFCHWTLVVRNSSKDLTFSVSTEFY
jgi:hypothetical protein